MNPAGLERVSPQPTRTDRVRAMTPCTSRSHATPTCRDRNRPGPDRPSDVRGKRDVPRASDGAAGRRDTRRGRGGHHRGGNRMETGALSHVQAFDERRSRPGRLGRARQSRTESHQHAREPAVDRGGPRWAESASLHLAMADLLVMDQLVAKPDFGLYDEDVHGSISLRSRAEPRDSRRLDVAHAAFRSWWCSSSCGRVAAGRFRT